MTTLSLFIRLGDFATPSVQDARILRSKVFGFLRRVIDYVVQQKPIRRKKETNLLEKVGPIRKAEKWNRIRHHPDVASAAVEIRFAPFTIFVGDTENFVVESLRVRRLVGRVRMISCNSVVKSLLVK